MIHFSEMFGWLVGGWDQITCISLGISLISAFCCVFLTVHCIGSYHRGLWDLRDASLSHFQGHRIPPTHHKSQTYNTKTNTNTNTKKSGSHDFTSSNKPDCKHCQRHNGPRNWLRNLDSIWQQHGSTYISCKFGHQMAPLALVTNLSTTLSHMHCHIELYLPIGIIS